jgi:hypothetical protein
MQTMSLRTISALGATLITAALAAPAQAADATVIPANLQAAAGQTLVSEMPASGVQIYVCAASKADASKFEWSFKAPEAQLSDAAGKPSGKHYAGPTWEGLDGSKVVGEVKARADAPVAGAIPWLLLTAKSNAGSGVFAQVVAIQRVATVSGKAPAEGCAAADAGKELRVPYQALYRFFAAQ